MNDNEVLLGSVCLLAAVLVLTVPRLRRSPSIARFWPVRVMILATFGALLIDSGIRGRDSLDLLASDLLLGAVIMLAAERGRRSHSRVNAPPSEVR